MSVLRNIIETPPINYAEWARNVAGGVFETVRQGETLTPEEHTEISRLCRVNDTFRLTLGQQLWGSLSRNSVSNDYAEVLIDLGADVNFKEGSISTLDRARNKGLQQNVIDLLVAKGAVTGSRNSHAAAASVPT